MKLGHSNRSNKIYAGSTRKNKNGTESWVKKEDVTDMAIASVFEWMMWKCREGGTGHFDIRYPSVNATMSFDVDDLEGE